jgi:nicotinate-nucleotide adenylyltransferase
VLGGTFDPVHLGHLRMATEARRLLDLERTLLVPAARPPHKAPEALSPTLDRLAMLRLAIEGLAGLEVSTIELERPGVGYTIDTLRLLREGRPPRDPVFILGLDALVQLPSWRGWRALLEEFDLAVVARVEDGSGNRLPPEIAARVVAGPAIDAGRGGRVFRLPIEPVAVSSSAIRERARSGGGLDGLVPPGVARYIQRTGLYRREDRT